MTEQTQKLEQNISQQAKEVYKEARPWIKTMGRIGYVSKGVVYLTLGLLILRALVGLGSPSVDTKDAMAAIEGAPLGSFLLLFLALGLVGYVAWRLIQAIVDPEKRGTDLKGLAKRGVYVVSGLSYVGLVILAVQMVIGMPAKNNNSTQDWTARVLLHPFGRWLIILFGAGVLAVGLYQFYMAATAIFRRKLEERKMSRLERISALASGRIGFISRGLIISAIGFFLIRAALNFDPAEAASLGEVLLKFAMTPYGPFALGVIGFGFLAFGIYIILIARFGRYVV